MRQIKAVYLLLERLLFNSIPRKILGCMVPLFALLLFSSWQSLDLVRTLRSSLSGPAATPETLALLARTERMATLFPWLALAACAIAFLTVYLSLALPLKRITKVIREGDLVIVDQNAGNGVVPYLPLGALDKPAASAQGGRK